MINLLTGKNYDRTFTDSAPSSAIEKPWTAEAYRTAMRRLLNEAGQPGNHTASYVSAATALAIAAQSAPETLDDAPPAETPSAAPPASRVRINTGPDAKSAPFGDAI